MSTTTAALAPVPGEPIRVLEIVGNAIVGGMESYVERLIERLPRDRFAVTALLPFEGTYADRLRALDVEVLVTPIQDNVPWCSVQLACSLIESNNIDVLHSHLTNAHVVAGLSGRLTETPVLATIHGRQLTMLDLEVHRTTGTHLAVLCTQSHFHALGIGVSPARVSCIPNGVDTELFRPRDATVACVSAAVPPRAPDLESKRQAMPTEGRRELNGSRGPWRESLGIPAGAPLVGFVGRLSPEKGPEVFVRAALLVHAAVPAAHFVLVGDGPMRERLLDLCGHYSLASCVHFAGVCGDMPRIYHELDLVVSTSHSEAMPLALMEAMASGLPLIATRVGGVPDLVIEGGTGRLVEPGDFEAVAFHVEQLLASSEQREHMAAAARTRAVERFGLTESVNRTANLLMRLALSKRAESRKISSIGGDVARRRAGAARLNPDARIGIPSDRTP